MTFFYDVLFITFLYQVPNGQTNWRHPEVHSNKELLPLPIATKLFCQKQLVLALLITPFLPSVRIRLF